MIKTQTLSIRRCRLGDNRCHRLAILLPALLAAVSWLPGTVSSRATAQPPPTMGNPPIEMMIPAAGGIIRWQDVAASIAKAMTLDADSVKQMLPEGSIDLRSDTVMLTLLGINLAFGDSLSIDVTRDANDEPALRLRCRREAFAKAAPDVPKIEPKLHLDQGWNEKTGTRPLILCIHGMKGEWSGFDDFRDHLRAQGFATAAISYDDAQSIEDSSHQIAQLVDSRLGDLHSRRPPANEHGRPRLKIALVGHSMGGLIAREWVENPEIDSSQVSHVFTVATPHGGSNWASLPPMLNMISGDALDPEDLVDILLHQPTSQGLRDLQPGSEQLKRMAARHRHDRVSYTTIVGTHIPVNQSDLNTLRDAFIELDRNGSFVRLIRPRIKPLLESFDELVEGKGDGVVSVENATLADVEDIVFVPLAHGDMFRPVDHGDHPVWQAILERLSRANEPSKIKK